MFKKKKDLTEELRNRLVTERAKLPELSKKLEKLQDEDSENIEYKEFYKKLIEETIQHINELEEQYENVSKIPFFESKLKNLEKELYNVTIEINYSESDLTHLKFQLENKQHIISETEKEIAEIGNEMQETKSRLDELNEILKELAAQRAYVEKELKSAQIKADI